MATATMNALATITFSLNGRRRTVQVPPMKRLLDVLREDCGHTGTKEGCGEGECGACTVLMNGVAVNSCLVPVVQADGAKVLTVEGLAHGTALTALQRAFVELGGAQCGICTPGMLISAHELLTRSPGRVPSEQEVRDALAGNLCRCTGYQKIVDAVRSAARKERPATASRKAKAKPRGRKAPARKAKAAAKPAGGGKKRAARAPKRGTTRKGATTKKAARKAAPRKAASRKAARSSRRHR